MQPNIVLMGQLCCEIIVLFVVFANEYFRAVACDVAVKLGCGWFALFCSFGRARAQIALFNELVADFLDIFRRGGFKLA